MSDNKDLITEPSFKTTTANTLRSLADAIESGTVKQYEFKETKDGYTIKADSSDGKQRIIETNSQKNGYQRTSKEHIQKQTPDKRREVVKMLKQEGLSQTKIAEKTLCSQKTISNDLKKLRENGEI
jgi:DNA-binding NarL/FixJ family response regulator